jgi:hypothetical protein
VRSIAWLAFVLLAFAPSAANSAVAASPVPRVEQARIVALFGRTYIPGWLPPGYTFARWTSEPGSATVYGDVLLIDFGKHGDLIQWTVSDPTDPSGYAGDACSAHPYGAVIYRVAGKRVVFQSGNHGADAIVCLSPRIAVDVWNGHTLSPATQARIAGNLRAVG